MSLLNCAPLPWMLEESPSCWDRPLRLCSPMASTTGRKMTITRAWSTDPTGTKIRTHILQGKIFGLSPPGVSGLESTSLIGYRTQLWIPLISSTAGGVHEVPSLQLNNRLDIPGTRNLGDRTLLRMWRGPRDRRLERDGYLRMKDRLETRDPSFRTKKGGISRLLRQSGSRSDHRLFELIVSRDGVQDEKVNGYVIPKRSSIRKSMIWLSDLRL